MAYYDFPLKIDNKYNRTCKVEYKRKDVDGLAGLQLVQLLTGFGSWWLLDRGESLGQIL